jgi:mannose-6-phosphate isomerase
MPDGAEADATLDAYGHAFVILAQATAARAFGNAELAARAMETWQYVSTTFTDRHGGLLWHLKGPESWDQSPRSQNPLMHMFEALMALHSVDPSGQALTGAREILAFLRSLDNFEAGTLIERYTPDWKPLAVEDGGVVDLGHAFEWAFLLSDWSAIRRDPTILPLGEAFLHTGVTWGVDTDGGVRGACDASGQVAVPEKGLWQQCEAIRALHRYVRTHGKSEFDGVLRRTLSFYRDHFVDAEYGGVFDSIDREGRPAKTDKGHVWKLDYHSANMCLELLGGAPPSADTEPA